MNSFFRSVTKIFTGAAQAFRSFPVSIAAALAFAVVTLVRIQLDWNREEPYALLFNSLQWALALGAFASLAAITAAQRRFDRPAAFWTANGLGLAASLVAFLALYLPGDEGTGIGVVRVGFGIIVSLLLFIVLAGQPQPDRDFSNAFFMTLKAFFIAMIYGLVIQGGLSGVAFAVEALIYNAMSEKVYQYIATLAGFLAFTIFVGYFPDFRRSRQDPHWETAERQPRFIEILFGFIMVPIVLALTVVLLVWVVRTILTGTWPPFTQLAGIATGYALGGIWLHIMVTHHEHPLTVFYRKFYPMAALLILAFEAWAVVRQLASTGLKLAEYTFILIWLFAVITAILLLARQIRAHVPAALLACILLVFSVLPILGYHALPIRVQLARLEQILVREGLLADGQLVAAEGEVDKPVREAITDAVTFVGTARNAELPVWFVDDLANPSTFRRTLGFEQTWPDVNAVNGPGEYRSTQLLLAPGAYEIDDYRWALHIDDFYGKGSSSVSLEGDRGTYLFDWQIGQPSGLPRLTVERDGQRILDQDFKAFADAAFAANQAGSPGQVEADLETMSLALATDDLEIMLIFGMIDIYEDPRQPSPNYYLNLRAIYVKEKP
jgi:hypothetical protein